jgi:hypothetical protein
VVNLVKARLPFAESVRIVSLPIALELDRIAIEVRAFFSTPDLTAIGPILSASSET